MGKDAKEDDDWLGFDKLAKMLGEFPVEDSSKLEAPMRPPAEKPTESPEAPTDADAPPKTGADP
jgi:hypothetical protein